MTDTTNFTTDVEAILTTARATQGEQFAYLVSVLFMSAQLAEVLAATVYFSRKSEPAEICDSLEFSGRSLLAGIMAKSAYGMTTEKVTEARTLADQMQKKRHALMGL